VLECADCSKKSKKLSDSAGKEIQRGRWGERGERDKGKTGHNQKGILANMKASNQKKALLAQREPKGGKGTYSSRKDCSWQWIKEINRHATPEQRKGKSKFGKEGGRRVGEACTKAKKGKMSAGSNSMPRNIHGQHKKRSEVFQSPGTRCQSKKTDNWGIHR